MINAPSNAPCAMAPILQLVMFGSDFALLGKTPCTSPVHDVRAQEHLAMAMVLALRMLLGLPSRTQLYGLLIVSSVLPAAGSTGCEADSNDDTIVVAQVARCMGSRPTPKLAELPSAGRPLVQAADRGGPKLTSPRMIAVFFGDDPLRAPTLDFLESYGCSAPWREAVNEYGIRDASFLRALDLPQYPEVDASTGTGDEFEDWVREQTRAGVFGRLEEQDILVFFTPAGAERISDDYGGYHSEASPERSTADLLALDPPVSAPDPGTVKYVVVYRSKGLEPRLALDERTFTASHELVETATDPYPFSQPGWRGLDQDAGGFGSVITIDSTADELADFCPNRRASLEYPFIVTSAYSNRQARAGLDPCRVDSPVQLLLTPRGLAADQTIDLSDGTATLTFDFYGADPDVTYYVSAETALIRVMGGAVQSLFLGSSPQAFADGDTVTLEITLTPEMLHAGGADDHVADGHLLRLGLCEYPYGLDCMFVPFPLIIQ